MIAKRFHYILVASFGGVLLSILLIASLSPFPSNVRAKSPDDTTLEIYSWFAPGRETNALYNLIDVFTSTYTTTSVIVSSDRNELTDRITSGNPPDSIQSHCGAELFYSWIEPDDYIKPVTWLWTDQDLTNKFPQDLVDMLTFKGEFYCVPLNIHRGNVLWYNKQVFSDTGLTPPTTFTEFFTVAEALETAGKIPLALGDSGAWADVHLMETVLLGSLGPDKYRGLWNGTVLFNGSEVKEALETFDHMMDYVNTDHATLSWDEAVQLVGNGDAGMTIMGDWAQQTFDSMSLTPDVDYGWVPVPGNIGSFMLINDSFVMPRNAPHAEEATNWQLTVASIDGQDAFSPLKGSIPSRLDVISSTYGVYQQGAMAAYATDELVPSLIHGVAAPPPFVDDSNDIVSNFTVYGDVDATANAWQQAACEAGFGKCYATISPTETNTLVYTDTRGLPTTIQIPAGAVTETIILVYLPVETITPTSCFAFAGHAFDLDAYLDGTTLLPGFIFSGPVTIKIDYNDKDIAGLDENTLVLKYWNTTASVWEDAACGPYNRHPDENWLEIPICHLSRFALFGKYKIYLPMVLRN